MTSKTLINKGFILAAGLGQRLRPYTNTLPKPLVPAGGRPIIDHVLDSLQESGLTEVTVNLHYKADLLADHLATRTAPQLTFSIESILLDTGGGIKNALHTMGDGPFYVVSGDSFWTEGPGQTALARMSTAWDPARMDMLLMLQPLDKMTLTQGKGDYDVLPDGRAVRSKDKTGAHMWTSIRLCSPALFDDTPDGPFSFLTLMDRAEARGRLYALVHEGEWYHISTPSDLEQVNAALRKVPA